MPASSCALWTMIGERASFRARRVHLLAASAGSRAVVVTENLLSG